MSKQFQRYWHRLQDWLRFKVADPFVAYCKQDAEPDILARSFAVGFSLGLCPVVGLSTGSALLVLAITKSFAPDYFHTPMTLLANFTAIPVEVALILPCMRLGEVVLGAEKLPVTGVGFRDLWDHPAKVLPVVGHALMGFVILLPFFIVGLTFALRPVFTWCKRRFGSSGGYRPDEETLWNDDLSDSEQQLLDEDSGGGRFRLPHGMAAG
ncbi:hypothetical protein WJX74_007223 [Apatococcus lobatus]|uniref:DUF2062 domain-containing protein n=1 Tax=Apatococcus lobatus TaxID=904363 RepID=A0AAW1SH40_9CHLO